MGGSFFLLLFVFLYFIFNFFFLISLPCAAVENVRPASLASLFLFSLLLSLLFRARMQLQKVAPLRHTRHHLLSPSIPPPTSSLCDASGDPPVFFFKRYHFFLSFSFSLSIPFYFFHFFTSFFSFSSSSSSTFRISAQYSQAAKWQHASVPGEQSITTDPAGLRPHTFTQFRFQHKFRLPHHHSSEHLNFVFFKFFSFRKESTQIESHWNHKQKNEKKKRCCGRIASFVDAVVNRI